MEIGAGGAIAVDPGQLRELASHVDALVERVRESARQAREAAGVLAEVPAVDASPAEGAAAFADQLAERAAALAAAMRFAADAYELVELRARLLWSDVPDAHERRLMEGRMRLLEERSPGAGEDAERLLFRWRLEHGSELMWQLHGAPDLLLRMFGLAVPNMLAVIPGGLRAVQQTGIGLVPAGARLHGQTSEPRLQPVTRAAPGDAPRSFAVFAGRVPDGETATVRVERYELGNGKREFALYVAGTQFEEGTVLDWDSNLRLYSDERSQAYRAVELALGDAGAEPGDRVHAAGFSQGGMIVSRLAAAGEYDVTTLVTLGAPIEADQREGVLVVALRHDDDPVAMLAGGGRAYGVGSEESVVVSDTSHPARTLRDLALPAHRLDAYQETAERFQETGDPSLAAIDERLDALREAEHVAVYEYRPERMPARGDRDGGGEF